MIFFLKTTALNLPQPTRLADIVLILAVGLIHLYRAPTRLEAAMSKPRTILAHEMNGEPLPTKHGDLREQ